MPFKDRKHPERYDRALADDDDDYDAVGGNEQFKGRKSNKIRPSIFDKKIGLPNSELDKLKGLSKEDQQRRMRELAHEYSFFGRAQAAKQA